MHSIWLRALCFLANECLNRGAFACGIAMWPNRVWANAGGYDKGLRVVHDEGFAFPDAFLDAPRPCTRFSTFKTTEHDGNEEVFVPRSALPVGRGDSWADREMATICFQASGLTCDYFGDTRF